MDVGSLAFCRARENDFTYQVLKTGTFECKSSGFWLLWKNRKAWQGWSCAHVEAIAGRGSGVGGRVASGCRQPGRGSHPDSAARALPGSGESTPLLCASISASATHADNPQATRYEHCEKCRSRSSKCSVGLIVTRGAAFDGCVLLLCPTLERPSAKTRDVTRDLPKPPASGRAPRASRHRKREGEKHPGGARSHRWPFTSGQAQGVLLVTASGVNNSALDVIRDPALLAGRRQRGGECKRFPLKWSWETKGSRRNYFEPRQVTQASKFNEP